jgi:hypothetical protein
MRRPPAAHAFGALKSVSCRESQSREVSAAFQYLI